MAIETQNQVPTTDATPLPEQGAAPGAAPAAPGQAGILAGTGLDGIVAGYLKHITDIAKNSPVAQRAQAAEVQKKLAASTPVDTTKPPAPAPGSFGSKLIDAAQGVMGSLGDAAHASDTKGGWLSGVVNTLNARNQRIAQQQKDSILMAKSQAENIALHRNFYQQDLEHRQTFHEGNKKFFDQYRESNDMEDGISQEEVFNRMKTDKDFAKNYLVRATAEIPVVDENGNEKMDKQTGLPVMKPTYTVMSTATKDGSDASKTISAEESAQYNKLLGLKYPVGTKLTMAQDNALSIKLAAARDTSNILAKTNGGKELSPDVMASIRPLLTDPTVTSAISEVPGKPYEGIVRHMKNADDHIAQAQQEASIAKQQKNQSAYDAATSKIASFQEEKQKLTTIAEEAIPQKTIDDFNKRAGDSNLEISGFLADPSKIQGHSDAVIAAADDVINTSKDAAVISQARRVKQMAQNVQLSERQNKVQTATDEQVAKDKASRIDNNPNGLSGEAFIKSLPPGRANLVRALAEGRLPVNATAFERSTAGKSNPLADDVYAAYPDFNAVLGQEWPKSYANFMINGVDHKKALAYNTALLHMRSLYDHTTLRGLTPGTQEYNDRQVDINNFSREVGNALSTGVLTQAEHDEITNALDSWKAVTPDMKKERIRETARLLYGKISEQQREFDATKPSAGFNVPKLLGPDPEKSYNYVVNGEQKQPQPGQNVHPNQPPNTVYMKKPDGNYVYVSKDKQAEAEKLGAKVVQ